MGLKLLFVRFSSIGDIVLTSAAIRCAKNQLKDVEIHFLTKKSMKMVMENSPYIDHFHYLERDFSTLVKSLKEEQFDYVIDLHKNLRTLRLKFALGVPALSYFKANVAKWLLSKFGLNKMPNRHVALRYLDTLSPLGVQYDGLGLDFHLPKQLEEPTLPDSFQGNYVAFVIGATYFTKKMPVQKIIELIHQVDAQIILIGGKAEKEEGDQIASHYPEKVWNACGDFSLHQSALLVKNAQLVISHDTGLMHIACAYSKNMIMLWGGTSPALQFYPFYPDHSKQFAFNALVQGLNCQPCSHFGLSKCPKGHFNCMNQQDLPKIASEIQAILTKLPE